MALKCTQIACLLQDRNHGTVDIIQRRSSPYSIRSHRVKNLMVQLFSWLHKLLVLLIQSKILLPDHSKKELKNASLTPVAFPCKHKFPLSCKILFDRCTQY
jgi:hypothetical protein